MKQTILITVSYSVEMEPDDFWIPKGGRLQPQIYETLKKRFPNRLKLRDGHYATREKLIHIIIDTMPNMQKCPSCGRWMLDTTKPNQLLPLRAAKELAGTLYCESCEWELRPDLQKQDI